MPTENRSSNTEMVSDLLPCPFCKAAMRIESNRDWHRLMGDHDDECVFIDPETMTVPATDEQRAIMVNDWNRRAQPAEKHQGEPVLWRYRKTPARNWFYTVHKRSAEIALRDGYIVEEFYTHADPGEVERHVERRMELAEQKTELYRQIETLRAKLAERDALLRDIKLHGTDCFTIGGPSIRERIDAAISTSAEPSEPIAWHVGGNGYDRICFEKPDDLPGHPCIQAIHDQRQLIDLLKRYDLRDEGAPSDERQDLTDEQIIEAMRPDLNNADGGHVVDTSPNDVVKAGRALLACAMQGAPVERDERAAFESWYIRDVGIGLANLSRINSGGRAYEDEDAMAAWEGWQARAALERKPQESRVERDERPIPDEVRENMSGLDVTICNSKFFGKNADGSEPFQYADDGSLKSLKAICIDGWTCYGPSTAAKGAWGVTWVNGKVKIGGPVFGPAHDIDKSVLEGRLVNDELWLVIQTLLRQQRESLERKP